jgi:hypothetical protein
MEIVQIWGPKKNPARGSENHARERDERNCRMFQKSEIQRVSGSKFNFFGFAMTDGSWR